jgi:hypothetical protein
MKTEMVFETLVSTKVEPHYPADSLKELLHMHLQTLKKSVAQCPCGLFAKNEDVSGMVHTWF